MSYSHPSIEHFYRTESERTIRRLRAGFATLTSDLAADAFQEAALALLIRQKRGLPCEDLGRLGRTIAWRAYRAEYRSWRIRERFVARLDGPGWHLDTQLEARRELVRLHARVPKAASLFGGRQPDLLEKALRVRLTGLGDTDAATRVGVRREVVNRAMHWMQQQLAE